MKDEEIGLTFFTEGEPRSPDGLPSVFGVIDQAEMLARIDDVQDDDLASSFFADSLIEVEEAATRMFDVGVRPREATTVEDYAPSPAEPVAIEPAVEEVSARLTPDDVFTGRVIRESIVVEDVIVEDLIVDDQVVEETVTIEETVTVEETVVVDEKVAEEAVEPHEPPAETSTRVSRLGAAREEVVAMTRTVITVPGILSKSAEARRSFILGGPAAMDHIEQ